jgi:hypothetical protein
VVNLRARRAKDRALNRLLTELQSEYERRLGTQDELLQLSAGDIAFVQQVMDEELAKESL